MKPEQCRLFLALWPAPGAVEQLTAHVTSWNWPNEATLYQPSDWHLTLHFIGNVPQEDVEPIAEGLKAPFSPFDIELNRPTLWPHGLAVLTSAVPHHGLSVLHMRLARALNERDLPVDTRPFQPHITLARKAQTAHAPQSAPAIGWTAKEYVLAQSTGLPERRYRIIRRYAASG